MLSLRSTLPPLVITGLAILVLRRLTWRKRHSKRPSPPGPTPLPIIGNLHQFPKSYAHKAWREWGKKYGPIVQIKIFSQPIIIVNSHQVATELLSDRGQIYSGRPWLQMLMGEVGWAKTVTFMDPCESFRETRRMFHRVLDGRRLEQFREHVELETHKFIARMFRDPEGYRTQLRTTAAAVILLISHGYVVDPRPNQDPFVKLAEQTMKEASYAAVPGRWLVDVIPILQHLPTWFPGATFKRIGEEYRKNVERFVSEPHEWAKDAIKSGKAYPSCTHILLEEMEDAGKADSEKEDRIKWTTNAFFGGGSDTSVSLLSTFFLAVSRNPEIAVKAQEELDAVMGTDRFPTIDDRPNLPYIEAILTEVLRFAPPLPGAMPHKVMEDNIYDGYFIEKGTMVIPNVWGISHDEELYPTPFEFTPERYLEEVNDSEGGASRWKYVPAVVDPRVAIFGYGRRFCPGRDLGLLTTWNAIACTLQVFDVRPKEDVVAPISTHAYEDLVISHPSPFDCIVTPRSPKAEALILSTDPSEMPQSMM